MKRLRLALLAAVVTAGVFASSRALAAWPATPTQAVSVLDVSDALQLVTVSDGAGGIIAVWSDYLSGSVATLAAQRVDATGNVRWAGGGVAVTASATATQLELSACSDGAGGVIVAWRDYRGADTDIYAQRLGPDGSRLWTATGVPVCAVTGEAYAPRVAPGAAGGAVIVWQDGRPLTSSDIYAQQLNATGNRVWTANGIAVCTAANSQSDPHVISDGAQGAVVVWVDQRAGAGLYDLYAQRVSVSGASVWGAGGYPLCTATGSQVEPDLVPDGTGGAIFCWADSRVSGNEDVYVARVLGNGANAWTTNGAPIGGAVDAQDTPAIVSDGASGAIVVWRDARTGETDLYAQRVGPSGAPQWTANGVALCTATGSQSAPAIATDDAGGAIVAWTDNRAGIGSDLYARRVNSAGTGLWTSSGTLLLTDMDNQFNPVTIADGAGGILVTCLDARGLGPYYQVRAQHLDRYGFHGEPGPRLTSVRDVSNDQGGRVKVSWDASYLDADPTFGIVDYRVWRSAPAALVASGAMAARGVTRDPDAAAAQGRWLVMPLAGQDVAWELVGTQTAALLSAYSLVVETTADSAAAGNPRTTFMVEARAGTSLSSNRWYSAPDSGYSVDNLAPAMPAPFSGQYLGAQTALDWNANLEGDLAGYRLYRGASVSFAPSEANRIASLADTDYLDPAGAPYVYKLTAVDVHGNESPAATVIPAGTTGVDDAVPVFAFAAPQPNPATGPTALRFTLAEAGDASVVVYDAGGRVVRTVASGTHAAGAHAVPWDLRDEVGARVAPGMYFARVSAGTRQATRKLIVAK